MSTDEKSLAIQNGIYIGRSIECTERLIRDMNDAALLMRYLMTDDEFNQYSNLLAVLTEIKHTGTYQQRYDTNSNTRIMPVSGDR